MQIHLTVQDVFRFDDRMVIVSVADQADAVINAATATVSLNGEPVGTLRLTGQRMPGSRGGAQVAVETDDSVDWDRRAVVDRRICLAWEAPDPADSEDRDVRGVS